MNEGQEFVLELKKHLENSRYMIAASTLEAFRDFVSATVDSLLNSFINKDMAMMEQTLKEQRMLRKMITEELRRYQDEVVVISSKYVQTYNLMKKLAQNERRKRNIAETMKPIEQAYSYAKQVLTYLYRHTNVQHKILVSEIGIPKSTLSDFMKILETAGCVEKIEQGKFSFFNLTAEGRKYVKETVADIDEEIIVDQRSFRSDVLQLIENKTDFEDKTLYTWRGYKKNTGTILETGDNGIPESAKWRDYKYFSSEYVER